MHGLQICVPPFSLVQNGDVMGMVGSGVQESAGETHNPVNRQLSRSDLIGLSSSVGTVGVFSENVNEQSKHHWHAAGVHPRRDKRKESDSREQEKTSASQQSTKNWNTRESDLCAPSFRNAKVVQTREKSARGQEYGCRDCQHTHNTKNAPNE